jgi:universal stress protein E
MTYRIRNILIAVADPAVRANKAVRRGVEIARRSGASIELFNSVALTGSYGDISRAESREFARLLQEQGAQQLEATAKRLRRDGLTVNVAVELGYPASDAIVRRVNRTRPDLVIIEAHKHNVFARLLLSQTDYGLIRDCPVPLLIVKTGSLPSRPLTLAALDPWHAAGKPASLDARILEVARGVAGLFNGSVHTAHVYAPLVGFVAGTVGAPSSIPVSLPDDKRYKASVQRQFRRVNQRHAIGSRNAHLRSGDPAIELPFLARSLKAGMVVMGAVSRSAIKRLFIGNTAERVLDSLTCDVLIVKPAA